MSTDICINFILNLTNHTHPVSLDPYKAIAGGVSFLLTLPFVLFHFGFFPIGSTAAILVGAFWMVVLLVVSQDEVYEVIGESGNLRTIFLLLGMMLLAQYFERELLIDKLMSKFLKPNSPFIIYLFTVTFADFFIAAIFTNDVACVVLTPLILNHWRKSGRPLVELGTLLLGIATTANIGSVTTIFGNPQMALIASKTMDGKFKLSQLDMRRCIFYLWLPALICYVINFGFLMIHYMVRLKFPPARLQTLEEEKGIIKQKKSMTKQELMTMKVQTEAVKLETLTKPASPIPSHIIEVNGGAYVNYGHDLSPDDPISQATSRKSSIISVQSMNKRKTSERYGNEAFAISESNNIFRSLSIGSLAMSTINENENQLDSNLDGSATNSRIFHIILCLNIGLVVALFLSSNDKVQFDTGLVPMGAAVMVICVDAAMNKRSSMSIMRKVDWSVLMMFFGIFVWLYGLNSTKIPRLIWQKLGLDVVGLNSITGYVILYLFIVVGSNIFSNVPLTIIVLELLAPCVDQLDLILYLGWLSTIAGNLTLFGSVANLIVAQKSFSTIEYHFGFFEYLEFGLVTTVFLSILGMLIIYGLLLVI